MTQTNTSMQQPTSIDPDEVEQFSRIAEEWWDESGKFKPLHDINPTRIGYIKQHICEHFGKDVDSIRPFSGLKLLDIGCGGGLICEPMTRLGADVSGVDASEKNIKTAALHAEQSGLEIDYRASTAESLVENKEQFDVVLALEIIEHVVDPDAFIASCSNLVKPDGVLIMSTINRTAKSYAMAIIGAEYILRLMPRGTHDWKKFVKPSEMRRAMESSGLEIVNTSGMVMNPLKWEWRISDTDIDVNYLMIGKK